MKKLIFVLPLTAVLAWAGISALAQDSSFQMDMMHAHQKMMQDMMAMKSTGDADKDFVKMMIPHHQGAIDMAEAELKYGKDPQLKKMAQQTQKAAQDAVPKDISEDALKKLMQQINEKLPERTPAPAPSSSAP